MSARGWLAWAVVWVLAGLVWLLWPEPPEIKSPPAEVPLVEALPITPADGLTVVRDSEFDRRFGAPDGTPENDLKAVAGIWDAALLLVKDHDRFPLPDNAAITAFLQGKNPHRVAWIRPGHPAVSPQGELLDRWESPLFFHRESSRRTTLHSAGPDRAMWTDDDVVWPREP